MACRSPGAFARLPTCWVSDDSICVARFRRGRVSRLCVFLLLWSAGDKSQLLSVVISEFYTAFRSLSRVGLTYWLYAAAAEMEALLASVEDVFEVAQGYLGLTVAYVILAESQARICVSLFFFRFFFFR